MNRIEDARCLLLEQLESRCMLAGGALTHSSDSHLPRERPSADHHQSREVKSHSQDARSELNEHSHREKKEHHRRHQDGGHSKRHESKSAKPPPSTQETASNRSLQSLQPSGAGSETFSSRSSDSRGIAQGVSNSVSQLFTFAIDSVPTDPSNTQLSAGGLSFADRSNESVLGEGEGVEFVSVGDGDLDASPSEQSERVAQSESDLPRDERNAMSTSVAASPQVDRSAGDGGRVEQHQDNLNLETEERIFEDSGLIDTIADTRRDLSSTLDPAEDSSEVSDRWKVSSELLERVRGVVVSSEVPAATGCFHATDAAIASWFNQATGLIDIEVFGELQTPVDHIDTMVDVVLDTAVGVRRSVDILAANAASQDGDSVRVRDAVLAAIDSESMPLVSDLSRPDRSYRFSSVSAPAVALLATGITLVAKRSRRRVLMQASRRRGAREA